MCVYVCKQYLGVKRLSGHGIKGLSGLGLGVS